MNFSDKQRFYLSISIISATIAISCFLYSITKSNAYEISIGEKPVAYVSKNINAESLVKDVQKEIKQRFGNAVIKDEIYVSSVRADKEEVSSNYNEVRTEILNNTNLTTEAALMLSDGHELAYVAGENEGKQVLELIKAYYIAKNNINPQAVKILNNITYSKKTVLLSKIIKPEDLAKSIEEFNEKSKYPVISFQFKYVSETKQTISPSTVINWSGDILKGTSKVKAEGENGEKLVSKEITMENSKIVSSKLISEKITKAPKSKIILSGTKSPGVPSTSAFLTPSRGSISSSFGFRWGKMHNGIDIAANTGAPIYAALDGKVVYAGWEEGYGYMVKISHGNGLETIYGHSSKLLVSTGKTVKKGDKIALVGSTGNSTGPHLHFEVRVNGVAKNPTQYLNI